ncbi:MAG: hypothetical protein PVI03_07080 [Candidatus Thorarchaeota archaeon]|jgi:hypothetical protein
MKLPIHEQLAGTTQALFYEHRHFTTCQIPAPYNLKEVDWKGSKSMYQIYMSYETEYEAAIALLGSWPHWQRLCKCKWFQPYKEKWDKEREVREEALAKKTLIDQTREGNVTAAKALLDKKKPRGRPVNHAGKPKEASKDLVVGLTDRLKKLKEV